MKIAGQRTTHLFDYLLDAFLQSRGIKSTDTTLHTAEVAYELLKKSGLTLVDLIVFKT